MLDEADYAVQSPVAKEALHMGTYDLTNVSDTQQLVQAAYATNEPLVIYDGQHECLVAMTPAVFERILFDSDLLNCEGRELLHM